MKKEKYEYELFKKTNPSSSEVTSSVSRWINCVQDHMTRIRCSDAAALLTNYTLPQLVSQTEDTAGLKVTYLCCCCCCYYYARRESPCT